MGVVLVWQIAATAALAAGGAVLAGGDGALSAVAGGLISIIAGLAAALVASRSSAGSAGGLLLGALRAEAVKIGLAAILLWLVLANYPNAHAGMLVVTFAVTIVIFAMAFFVRDY
ncbi:MAG: ATP synthase subunit I [Betaproteobacteria bacterium]|nr:ATP synthase subunit I [Betaproteobacteria bacterium]